ncbi:MAG: group II intron reverse transcriptase/maturase [Candidatus Scalindua sp.]|nr:group II intron reverse transcriptase/maturase [Candidatus Scalindua sp.]MDR4498745.1 group II intron reverse transcriptase/maturase [Candidatus Scalindua sp.]MDR4499047.1 group II intron reverse transcriptase/maturase [Candidatus Scalindua sp.]
MTNRCLVEEKQLPNTESGNKLSTKLKRLAEIARQEPTTKFTSLAHLLDEECLKESYRELNRDAAIGIDHISYEEYGVDLTANISGLVKRLKNKSYKAIDIRRVLIPKPEGGERALGILVLEDKIVQKAVAKILNAIYEQDFLEVSYGFRLNKNCHDALKALELAVIKGGINYILDIDIRGYFDNMNHKWLMRMLRERIVDQTVLRLIGKWLRVGIVAEGKRIRNKLGVPQGGTISPILSNIYLHYVVDLWIKKSVAQAISGRIYLIRYCDDFVIGCTGKQTAEDIWDKLPCRLIKFGLELSKEKCRLIEFGRRAYYQSKGGKKKLNTFDFLGFTHYMARSRRGGVKLSRKTIGRRMRKTLIVMNNKLREKRNLLPFRKLHTYLCRILNGYYNYYGFAGNLATLRRFEYAIRRMWYKWLNRRSHRKSFNWDQYIELLNRYPLPQPKILKGYNWIYSTNL